MRCYVEDTPVGAHRPFGLGLPGLVKGFHQEVFIVFLLGPDQVVTQEDRLVGLRRDRRPAGPTVARPADLGHDDPLFREGFSQHLESRIDMIEGFLEGNPFPVRQEVGRNEISVDRQLRIGQPDVPGFAGTHRQFQLFVHPVEVAIQLFYGKLATQDRLVANDHLDNILAVCLDDLDQSLQFPFVFFKIFGQPGPQRHFHAVLHRQTRNFAEGPA